MKDYPTDEEWARMTDEERRAKNAEWRAADEAEWAPRRAEMAKLEAEIHAEWEAKLEAEIAELGGPTNALREYKRRVGELEREVRDMRKSKEEWIIGLSIIIFFLVAGVAGCDFHPDYSQMP